MGFTAEKIQVGTSFNLFYGDPAEQIEHLRDLTKPWKADYQIAGLIFEQILTPLTMDDGSRLGTVLECYDVTENRNQIELERQQAQNNLRIKQALDNVSTNVMLADNDLNIIYTNNSMADMFRNAEEKIKSVFPSFNSNKLLGQNIDQFHKNPAHQRKLLSEFTSAYKANVQIADLSFSLIANPVFDSEKNRLGAVLEWDNRTLEVAIEREIDHIVESAIAGDLSNRLSEVDKQDFNLRLSQGLNRLLDSASSIINDTALVLDAMAHGDLTKSIEGEYQGIFKKLKNDSNSTVQKLTQVISQINSSATLVTHGSQEIAQGTADLSRRTESQAASLEETSASMEEMTQQIKESSENAKLADQLAELAQNQASAGGKVVKNAVTAMADINNASNKIADIIGVIDEIAFQTNLLALNAAVEAARAGEQGRGFAVVAGEVRNLAQRSAGAAKQIKDLIRDSVDKVNVGTDLVNESGNTLNEIVEAVAKVSSIITDISSSAAEQFAGIDQVNRAISEMDQVTQQNAALVEETTAAGENMSAQANSMMQLLSFFKYNESQH